MIGGELRLRFALRNGRSELAEHFARAPLRLSDRLAGTLAQHVPAYAVLTTGGGLLGEEHLQLDLRMECGSTAHLGSVGSLRLLPAAAASSLSLTCALDHGSACAILPDPLIPCAGARFLQTTTIDLANGASALIGDILSPGRLGHGERFAYSTVELALLARLDGLPLVQDALWLEPASGHLRAALGSWTHCASFYILGSAASPALLAQVRSLERTPDLRIGATMPGASLIVVRMLGMQSHTLADAGARIARLFWAAVAAA